MAHLGVTPGGQAQYFHLVVALAHSPALGLVLLSQDVLDIPPFLLHPAAQQVIQLASPPTPRKCRSLFQPCLRRIPCTAQRLFELTNPLPSVLPILLGELNVRIPLPRGIQEGARHAQTDGCQLLVLTIRRLSHKQLRNKQRRCAC